MVHVPSVGQAGNNPQLPSSQLKLNIYIALNSATQEATCTCAVLCLHFLNKDRDLEDTWMPRPPSMKTTK